MHNVPSTIPVTRKRVITWMVSILVPLGIILIAAMIWLWPSGTYQQLSLDDPYGTTESFAVESGSVSSVFDRACDGGAESGSPTQVQQDLECQTAQVTTGRGTYEVEIPAQVSASTEVLRGDNVKILVGEDLADTGVFVDFERTIPVGLLAALYAVVVVVVARWRGVRAIGGLILSFVVLFGFMIPALLEGGPPFWVGLIGSMMIMLVVLYFAHGISLRTTTALLGTFIGLLLTAGLAAWASDSAYLMGLGEEYSYMLASVVPEIRASGIVLTGLLVAGLGVLNDVTITQSSAVWEIKAAQPNITPRKLFAAGMRIGRDHIASTVYTIAFAYAGAALPMLMIVSLYDRSLLDSMMSAEMVEEVVRILVGSVGLVLAIPITTGIAVAVAHAVAETQNQAPTPADAVTHVH
ncbi:MAG TPA: YibE/F family protein [Enteractinococcus helveticum]|uniref:YibE/F family protein n=1 Tax=Enteractinococcus helveticum TaxID=1837282 RepID=A0A921K729_9MICC|nr:YibE/F family protein [Enteractinococcus helveticum]HJF14285.1 YibE/F family protein [Enteractinococcus helveticum]